MGDMTIQNAIHCMKAIICEAVCEECDYYGKTGTDHCEADAVRMAIKALEEQPQTTTWLGNYCPYTCQHCGKHTDSKTPYCAWCGRRASNYE